MSTLIENVNRIYTDKEAIKQAVVAKGVTVPDGTSLDEYAELIAQINSGVDTGDATATSNDIAAGKTAYIGGKKVTGTVKVTNAYSWDYCDSVKIGGSPDPPLINLYTNTNRLIRANGAYSVNAAELLDKQTADGSTFLSWAANKYIGSLGLIKWYRDKLYPYNNRYPNVVCILSDGNTSQQYTVPITGSSIPSTSVVVAGNLDRVYLSLTASTKDGLHTPEASIAGTKLSTEISNCVSNVSFNISTLSNIGVIAGSMLTGTLNFSSPYGCITLTPTKSCVGIVSMAYTTSAALLNQPSYPAVSYVNTILVICMTNGN